jgi:hypothetical protein
VSPRNLSRFTWPDDDLAVDNSTSTYELITQLVIIRENRGMTIDQVAQRMGVNKSTISRFERGNTNPTMKTIRRYAEAVGAYLATVAVPVEGSGPWQDLLFNTTDALENSDSIAPKELLD